MRRIILLLLLITALLLTACASPITARDTHYLLGFASQKLEYGALDSYYIAGYQNGAHPEGILDNQQVKAVYIEVGELSCLIIAVDCVGLDSGTVRKIRSELADFARTSGCDSINVVSTHTHAGVDTLGLWGPIGINGKNAEFMESLVDASVEAAINAYESKSSGKILYGVTETEALQRDSRDPQVYDPNLYQLRFVPDDETKNGVRIVSYAAHAESLRGKNRLISADFPGELARLVKESCGDELIFLPGAIGGLVMTVELDSDDLVNNMRLTAARLYECLFSITDERELTPELAFARVELETELDNTLFIYYKFLGIIGSDAHRGLFGGYFVKSELTLLRLGELTLALLPGEIFPELVEDTGNPDDGDRLRTIAKRYGLDFIPIGLANDELGYIVLPSDFVLDETAPYVIGASGHYEETNSVGIGCAEAIADAFERAASMISEKKG